MIHPSDLHHIFEYNPKTGEIIWKNPTGKRKKEGDAAGCKAPDGRVLIGINGRIYKAHRIIWAMMTGKWPNKRIDHINRNGFDNRWENLRESDQSENMRNKKEISSNTSGHRGVSLLKKSNKWRAYIKVNYKDIHLGCFNKIEDAISARIAAEKHFFGDFAPH